MSGTEKFEVGQQVHWTYWRDIYPGTVVATTKTTVTVRKDRVGEAVPVRTSALLGKAWIVVQGVSKSVEILENPEGETLKFTRRKDGAFRAKGMLTGSVLRDGWAYYRNYDD